MSYLRDADLQREMKRYYDESEYFDKKPSKLFQDYRILNIFHIYRPNKNERILDIGCGWGTISFAISFLCKEVIGLDYSQKSIDNCNALLKDNNIKFICADAQNTGFDSESFDVIISADLFEHLYPEVYENVLDECNRLLKKKGKLVIWTPNKVHILEILKNKNIILKKDISHVDYKSMDRLLESLTKRNFAIKKAYYVESHIPIINILERLLLRILPLARRRIAILAEKE